MKFVGIILLTYLGAIQAGSVSIFQRISLTNAKPLSPKISGGNKVNPGEIPYQVGMQTDNDIFCGGSLIHPQWVLSSAFCLFDSYYVKVYVGSVLLKSGESQLSSSIFIHPDFDINKFINDISLLKLPIPATLDRIIEFKNSKTEQFFEFITSLEINFILLKSIQNQFVDYCLFNYKNQTNIVKLVNPHNAAKTFVGEISRTSGWGVIQRGGHYLSNNLNYIDLTVISNEECETYYSGINWLSILCCQGDNFHSTCQGDIGGPLILHSTGEQIGVSSFVSNYDCSPSSYPTGFTRVGFFLDWISINVPDIIQQ